MRNYARQFFVLIAFATIFFSYHDKFFTAIDSMTMPKNENICKSFPDSITKRIDPKQNNRTFEYIESKLKHLNLKNGKYLAKSENPLKLAIIVPYRDRDRNLKLFLEYMHQFLTDQKANYGIYLTQPIDGISFNRALLMNIGYNEAMKDNDWNCFIFHDIDMLPENDANIYRCDQNAPLQMAVSISVYDYAVTGYFNDKYFGGINSFTPEQFQSVNGFSNSYFNWGVEDDDMLIRVKSKYNSISRLTPEIGRYFANCHEDQVKNPNRFLLYVSAKLRMQNDGLNSLNSLYIVTKIQRTILFTRFFVSYKEKT